LYEGKHYNKEKRKIVDKTIQKIKPFCKALKILSLEEIPKPDNMEEIEI
jgi:hypothetical protein